MANINISDLRLAGADLFLDSESYLNDLTEGEMTNTFGGGWSLISFNNCCNDVPAEDKKKQNIIQQAPKLHNLVWVRTGS